VLRRGRVVLSAHMTETDESSLVSAMLGETSKLTSTKTAKPEASSNNPQNQHPYSGSKLRGDRWSCCARRCRHSSASSPCATSQAIVRTRHTSRPDRICP
jgi:hypothetical protein